MFTSYLIILFLATCMISVLYWQVIQPVLLLSIRFRLFRRRDDLRRLAIEQEERFDSFAYRELESMICKVVSVVPARSLLTFVWFMFSRRYDSRSLDGIKRFHKEASKRLKDHMEETVKDGMLILTLNSPLIAIGLAIVTCISRLIGKFNNLHNKAENYIDELPMAA